MLKAAALAGRGSCSLIDDDEHEGVLNGKIILALQYAMEPALEHCNIEFGSVLNQNLGAVFRHQLIHKVLLMPES